MQESSEMYLETILILTNRNHAVRSVDIAVEMGYSKPSVSRAIHKLEASECIRIDSEGYIFLTDKGRDIAEKIYERHNVLSALFMNLGVSRDTAIDDACRIEHVISDESFAAIKAYCFPEAKS